MKRSLLGVVLCLSMFCANWLGQSAPCTVSDHTEYTKKIKEFTTEPVFTTELVDHLPLEFLRARAGLVSAPHCRRA